VLSKVGLRRKGFEPDNRLGTLKVPSKSKLLGVTLELAEPGPLDLNLHPASNERSKQARSAAGPG
jgi:hypothetical protein